jgi:hypothetical protein
MATAAQEQLYNEIAKYYSYADSLIKAVEESSHNLASEQFAIVEEITSKLEVCADEIINEYIQYVRSNDAKEVIEKVRSNLNQISAKIEECRNKILMLYQEDGNNRKFVF